ncbi:MAG: DMT family transporter, partial [Alphaproteobacteria bacterium]
MISRTMGPTEWLLLILLSVLWGGSFFFVEVALAEVPPLTLVLVRVGLAAVVMTAFVYMRGERLPGSLTLWGAFLVMGALNNLVPFTLITWGQTQIESGLAAILIATTPLFTVVLAHRFTGDERMAPNRLAGVAVGLCGVAVLIGPESLSGLGLYGLGQVAILGAALSYAGAGVYGRRFQGVPSTVASAAMLVSTTVMMAPIAIVTESPWTLANPTAITWGAVLGLAVASTALAYVIYFRILAVAGATNILLVTFLVPVSAVILGTLVLGERLGWTAFAGMALISLGLAAVDGRLLAFARR